MPTPRMPVLRARAPAPMVRAVAAAAELAGQTPSAALRELLAEALRCRGLWPPAGPGGGTDGRP